MGKNVYTDAQLSFSKSCLFDALIRLLEEKELYEINVLELTETAGVSRSTFYRNYRQISDIIVEFLGEQPMGRPIDMEPGEYTLEELVEGYYDYFLANKHFFEVLHKRNLMHYFLDTAEQTFSGPFRPLIELYGFRTKYQLSGFIGMMYKVTCDWIAGGMKETKEEMTEIGSDLITAFHFEKE